MDCGSSKLYLVAVSGATETLTVIGVVYDGLSSVIVKKKKVVPVYPSLILRSLIDMVGKDSAGATAISDTGSTSLANSSGVSDGSSLSHLFPIPSASLSFW